MYKNFLEKYKNTSENVGKLQQIILLYEGAIRFLKTAKNAALENRIEEKFNALDKVSKIVNGLSISLDHKNGGEIALILENFYTSFYVKIFSLHNSKDLQEYDNLENSLVIMLNAWKDIVSQENLKPSNPIQESSNFTA